jgi:PLP dependent protein
MSVDSPFDRRLAEVKERIAAVGGDPDSVAVVAVTKGFGADTVRDAMRAGVSDIGENYAQELLAKAAALDGASAAAGSTDEGPTGEGPTGAGQPRWHFLGTPQRNKISRLAPFVTLWQGMDRAKALDHLAALKPGASILVQVNVVGDPAKAGCSINEVPDLVGRGRQIGLDVRGLMCVGPAGDVRAARRSFATLARLGGDNAVGQLSMGMSDDFEAAVSEGSTMVRLGRILFGPRPAPARVRR